MASKEYQWNINGRDVIIETKISINKGLIGKTERKDTILFEPSNQIEMKKAKKRFLKSLKYVLMDYIDSCYNQLIRFIYF